MKWGEITWIFLHALSVHISPEQYTELRTELMVHIQNLCDLLPCPLCATHATQYIRRVNIPTQPDFVRMLVDFHNSVNIQLQKPLFMYDNVSKYKGVSTTVAFHLYSKILLCQPYNPRMIMNKVRTQMFLRTFHQWLIKNKLILQ